jgi:hypothetical protein
MADVEVRRERRVAPVHASSEPTLVFSNGHDRRDAARLLCPAAPPRTRCKVRQTRFRSSSHRASLTDY